MRGAEKARQYQAFAAIFNCFHYSVCFSPAVLLLIETRWYKHLSVLKGEQSLSAALLWTQANSLHCVNIFA